MQKFKSYLAVTTSLKGGSGKSTFACAMLDNLRNNGVSVAAFDADGAVGSLIDMHGSRDENGNLLEEQIPTEGVFAYNIRDNSRSALFESLRTEAALIFHDVAGGALADWERVFSVEDQGLQDYFQGIRAQNACVVFMHLITPDRSTVESVAMHMDITDRLGDSAAGDLGKHARHIAVLNRYGNRKNEDFPDWFGFKDANGVTRGGRTRERLLADGGAEMDLPALSDRTMAMLKTLQIPFRHAARDTRLSLTDQQIVSIFCQKFDAAMSPQIKGLLGLSS